MNVFALIVLMLLADDSALVKAAKANGGLKKPIPKKKLTNADVKSSKGKIIELPPTGGVGAAAPGSARAPEAGAPTIAAHEAKKKALAAADLRVTNAEAKVADLEKELTRVEQSYYESADPNYRDTTITARFDQAKKQLDDARKELADARDARAALNPKPSP
jgi:hypothetical protein